MNRRTFVGRILVAATALAIAPLAKLPSLTLPARPQKPRLIPTGTVYRGRLFKGTVLHLYDGDRVEDCWFYDSTIEVHGTGAGVIVRNCYFDSQETAPIAA